MVRGAAIVVMVALAWACEVRASVLVPTYVLPPDSFVRDQRSLGPSPDSDPAETQRTVKRLVGGHIKIKPNKEFSASKNYIGVDSKSTSGKFAGVIAPELSGSTVGWNQGIWDDGMLMSSAGEGKDTGKVKEDDEDKKTLSDQVAEGKYGLIQNEIFAKNPKRPGIVSYEPNVETRSKDNLQSLGGLKKDEIWLAEDHLLVIKGGSFPEHTKETEHKPWPPIDSYEAPRRQVKLPQKPKVPPPFPVRLSDNGPLVFLTPNGSLPAPIFPPYFAGEGDGPIPPSPFLFTAGTPYTTGENQGNTTAGGASLPIPPFPFLPGNASEGTFPFPLSMNGSFPEGFPPGAAFLPPPSNQTDLYDEDDPSIYYPPPYNFSYHSEYNNSVPAGPLVPGIILPPPPDFFAPLEETTTTETATTSRPTTKSNYVRSKTTIKQQSPSVVYRRKYKTRPTTTESPRTTEIPSTVTTPSPIEIITAPKVKKPQRVFPPPSRNPVRVQNLPDEITSRPKTEKPIYKTRTKLTSKPISVSVIYDYPEQTYNKKPQTTSENPYVIYRVPQKTPNTIHDDIITSTQVPLRVYYSNTQNDGIPATKLQPVYRQKPNQNALASFYFYDEQPKTSPVPENYFDERHYYQTVPVNQAPQPQQHNIHQGGLSPAVDVTYGAIDDSDGLFSWPQKQGPRTLTQEYFSIQKPQPQAVYVQQPKQRPNTFYQEVENIQQTIDLFAAKRPKENPHHPYPNKQKSVTRPIYQFSYQTKPRPEQLTFRAPKLDPEPFRPMVSYSKPFNVENEFNAITPTVSPGYHQQYLVEKIQLPTEVPTSSRYYPKTKTRDEDYEDALSNKEILSNQNRNHIPTQSGKPASPINHVTRYPSTTPNPISNGYYTKQDESYFDERTRNSFDIFGQKVEDNIHDVNGLAVTPPLATVGTPVNNNINLQYAYEIVESQTNPPSLNKDTLVNERFPRPPINPDSEPYPGNPSAQLIQPTIPPSLLGDTLVNERFPRPTINPDSEFIPIPNPSYRKAAQLQKPHYATELDDLNSPSLAGDTAVNYKQPHPTPDPDAEWIAPVNTGGGRRGAFVSYRLPGEGAHVYFLTPQAAQAVRERHRSSGYGR